MEDDQLTPRQVAAELGVTVRTVQRWIADGRLQSQRVGGRSRVSRSSLASVARDGSRSAPRSAPAIRSLLVANRGEIAVRVARTARRLGMRVIGVHAGDERPPDGMDDAVRIGSYLDGSELLEVARRTGADAVHPGYGFLAERPGFAAAVVEAGLVWVGPPAASMAAMGDKAAARRRVAGHGVPTVPGYDGEAQDGATLAAAAERIGYPLLVKPAGGGGGKGMRLVRSPDALAQELAASRREARSSFGDDRLILERYLAGARHVEIQVLFDERGDGIHLGERDCSAQRRNQKIVEEAPAPSVSPELRERLGSAALRVGSAVGYASAGTVEMLVSDDGAFYFLEMNTRLQVEHPVTEAVTGRDLVADQLRIAGGEPLAALGLASSPPLRGHAIEARLYAEDPEAGFLPATGRLLRLDWPQGVRIDTGIRPGDEIGDRYDPLLAKIVAHARTRHEALARLRNALGETAIIGVRTNLRFLRWLLDRPAFHAGEMRTDTISGMELPAAPAPEAEDWAMAAAALLAAASSPWGGGWRLGAPPTARVACGDEERTVAGAARPGAAVEVDDGAAHVLVDGQSVEFRLAPPPTIEEAVRHASLSGDPAAASLVAPMPGRVVAVRADVGAPVRAHEPIVIIEAMKMEHAVLAPSDGTLTRLDVAVGAQVRRGDVLGEVRGAPEAQR